MAIPAWSYNYWRYKTKLLWITNFWQNQNLYVCVWHWYIKSEKCFSEPLNNPYTVFDANPSLEVRGIFLDLSKAFHGVWHKGFIHKLKNIGIDGNLLSLIESFLHNRYQRVVLNGQSSKWQNVNAGVPQGLVLGPLFFLIYVNDLPQGLRSDVKLSADDTSLFSVIHDVDASPATLNNDLVKIQEWAYNWKMSFNATLNNDLRKVFHPNLSFNDQPIERSVAHKHLGLTLDEKLSFTNCINDKINKTLKGVGLLRKLSTLLPRQSLLTIYKSFIRPYLDYGDVIYDQPLNESLSNRIESVRLHYLSLEPYKDHLEKNYTRN